MSRAHFAVQDCEYHHLYIVRYALTHEKNTTFASYPLLGKRGGIIKDTVPNCPWDFHYTLRALRKGFIYVYNDGVWGEFTVAEKEAVCTGHSLGGTLAAMTGYVFGFEAYAFNPYGIGKLTGSADGGAEGGGDIAAYMKKLGVTVRKNRETIHSFVNIGMFEQDFVAGLLTSATASHHVGSVHYLRDAPGNWFSIADKHTIGKTLENLGERRWADESEARNYLLRRCEEWLGCGDLPRAVRTALRPRGNAAWKYRRERIRRRISALRERVLHKRGE